MVQDSEAAVLLTESRFVQQFANTAIRVLVMDEERKQIEQQSSAELSRTTTGQNLAYVIYTSGSTGTTEGGSDYPQQCQRTAALGTGGIR